jgi:hypothetical protein
MQLTALLDFIPHFRRRRAPDWRQVLAAVPVRNRLLEWSEDDELLVTLCVPKRRDRVGRVLNRFFSAPEHRRVALDELGSDVWRLCDGERSVESIIVALARKYKLNRREVEVSLSLYLKQLGKRGYLGLLAAPAAPTSTQKAAKPAARSSRRKRKRCKQSSAPSA